MSMLLDPPGAAPQLATPVALRRRTALTAAEITEADAMLAGATPQEIVRWAVDTFGSRLVLTASFQDTTLIDIATSVDPDIEVVFLDTGFHFAETLNVVKRAMDRYALNLTVLRPDPDAADLWAAGTKACCDARKVVPLERYMSSRTAMMLSPVTSSSLIVPSPSTSAASMVVVSITSIVPSPSRSYAVTVVFSIASGTPSPSRS